MLERRFCMQTTFRDERALAGTNLLALFVHGSPANQVRRRSRRAGRHGRIHHVLDSRQTRRGEAGDQS